VVEKGNTIPGSSTWLAFYPFHAPRESEPHYALFRASRKLLIASGIGCWRCGDHDYLEAHHCIVEFALLNGISIEKIQKDFPEIDDTESLMAWASGPTNLEILCRDCHRGALGVHTMPFPLWEAQRWAKDDIQFLRVKPNA